MSEKIIGVYKISNKEDKRYYIGYSQNIYKRFGVHKSGLNNNKHQNIFMQRAYNKYGQDKFKFEIIHRFDTVEEAKDKEDEYLKNMEIRNEIYNLNYNNSGGDILSTHPDREKICKKISESQKKRIINMTIEERNKIFDKSGEKNGMYGKTHTKEAREIFSQTHKGNTYTKRNKKIRRSL
jgi:group I intron endonuclease